MSNYFESRVIVVDMLVIWHEQKFSKKVHQRFLNGYFCYEKKSHTKCIQKPYPFQIYFEWFGVTYTLFRLGTIYYVNISILSKIHKKSIHCTRESKEKIFFTQHKIHANFNRLLWGIKTCMRKVNCYQTRPESSTNTFTANQIWQMWLQTCKTKGSARRTHARIFTVITS